MKAWAKIIFIIFTCCICALTSVADAADNFAQKIQPRSAFASVESIEQKDYTLIKTVESEKYFLVSAVNNLEITALCKKNQYDCFMDSFFTFKDTEKGKLIECIAYTSSLQRNDKYFIAFGSEINTRAP